MSTNDIIRIEVTIDLTDRYTEFVQAQQCRDINHFLSRYMGSLAWMANVDPANRRGPRIELWIEDRDGTGDAHNSLLRLTKDLRRIRATPHEVVTYRWRYLNASKVEWYRNTFDLRPLPTRNTQ